MKPEKDELPNDSDKFPETVYVTSDARRFPPLSAHSEEAGAISCLSSRLNVLSSKTGEIGTIAEYRLVGTRRVRLVVSWDALMD